MPGRSMAVGRGPNKVRGPLGRFKSQIISYPFIIYGVTRDNSGNAIGSATVLLFEAQTNTIVGSTTSDTAGNYVFSIGTNSGYFYVVSFKSGSPNLAGTTYNNITANGIPAVPFTPSSIPGLLMWLDASQVLLSDSGGILTWPDQSGQLEYGTQTSTTNQPNNLSTTQNGYKAIHNDHSAMYFNLAYPLVLTDFDCFVAAYTTTGQSEAGIWLGAAVSGNVQMMKVDSGANKLILYDGSQSTTSTVLSVNPGTTHSVLETGRSSGVTTFYQNGTNFPTTIDFGSAAATITLGQLFRNDTSLSFSAETLAILMYSRLLTSIERTQVVNYLRTKFAI